MKISSSRGFFSFFLFQLEDWDISSVEPLFVFLFDDEVVEILTLKLVARVNTSVLFTPLIVVKTLVNRDM
jgi:hypothetical protein